MFYSKLGSHTLSFDVARKHARTHIQRVTYIYLRVALVLLEQSGIPRVYLKQVTEHHEILSCLINPALESRCMQGIDEYEI